MLDITLSPRRNEFSNIWEYELLSDVKYEYGGQTIIVPRYFSYDGATIPSAAWKLIYTPFDPIVMAPALVHDWIYCNHQVSQKDADQILRQLLLDNGAPKSKAQTIYAAVEIFGKIAWHNTAKDLSYLRWLKQKLIDNGVSIAKYRFAAET